MSIATKYYKVLPSYWFRGSYVVKVWRWWWPFWIEGVDGVSKEQAAEWIRGDSTYYDGAE